MTKVTVVIELDNEAYAKEYGPGSEHWNKYCVDRVPDGGHNEFGPTYHNVVKPASAYEPMEGKLLNDAIIDVIREGFYDWISDSREWLKITIDGKAARQCCHTLEGDKHKDWCPTIAGPEASEG